MSRTVDLHGLLTEEASIIIVNNLFDLENDKVDSITFITGIGTGALKYVVEDQVEKFNFNWTLLNNGGAYFVTKKINNKFIYDECSDQIDEEEIDYIFKKFENKKMR
ncbi:Smr/MutS family protein [Mycoplasmopsis ciconiae]|uniref:Smr/MutS family protein n=1 Tax=Mycoplasmopsis ciconiae TaxID=561067 RepID=A0ABU7MLK3_9BACT|nr:Smr/MutS family protein [Mycoplasmopsis ciconiae]